MNNKLRSDQAAVSRRGAFHAFALWAVLAGWLAVMAVPAQATEVGDLAREFTITDRATGEPIRLGDYAGQVLLLDFFAYWCGPCQRSSPDVELNIKQYYDARGGNAHGVPVTVLPVNIERNNEAETDSFIQNAGLGQVANDYAGSAYFQFSTGGIPLFVIISGVPDSDSHSPWEVLYRGSGYPGAPALRAVIDSVRPSNPTAPPRIRSLVPSQFLAADSTLNLWVRALGGQPLRYQWLRDDQPLPGATQPSFQVIAAQPGDSGRYQVEIANDYGTNRSAAVNVRIVLPGQTRTFAATDVPRAIPDGAISGIASQIVVGEPLEILRLRLNLRIRHTFISDLQVRLTSPSGFSWLVHDHEGGSGDNVILTAVEHPAFVGKPAQGTWTLGVLDSEEQDAGILESWSMEILSPAVSAVEAFNQWIAGHAELPAAQRAPEADADGDGWPNFLEYFVAACSPLRADAPLRFQPAVNEPDYLEFGLHWRPGVDARACQVFLCDDVGKAAWTEAADRGDQIKVDRTDPTRLVIRAQRNLPRLFLQFRADAGGQ